MARCEREDVSGLVAAAQGGDPKAFERLVHRFRPTALLVAAQTCGNQETAEDAVQDAFLIALRAVKNLDDPARFGPWLATIVRNRARRLARGGRRCGPLDHDAPYTPAPPCEAEAAIRALPEGVRESMGLYYLEGWSVGEIAALLERPATTVKWQLHAGRALLKRRMTPPTENP